MENQRLVGVVGWPEDVECEVEFADEGVADALASAGFFSDVVGGPLAAEVGAVH
jgi:hypothetical protein